MLGAESTTGCQCRLEKRILKFACPKLKNIDHFARMIATATSALSSESCSHCDWSLRLDERPMGEYSYHGCRRRSHGRQQYKKCRAGLQEVRWCQFLSFGIRIKIMVNAPSLPPFSGAVSLSLSTAFYSRQMNLHVAITVCQI